MSKKEANFEHWTYFKIIDCVINCMKNTISVESLKNCVGMDNFIQLKYYEERIEFVNKYEVLAHEV